MPWSLLAAPFSLWRQLYAIRHVIVTAKGANVLGQEMGVNIARIYQGFISKGLAKEGGPEGFFADVSETTFVVKSCLYNTQTLILDAVVVRTSSSLTS